MNRIVVKSRVDSNGILQLVRGKVSGTDSSGG
jgi:hypothetical protein